MSKHVVVLIIVMNYILLSVFVGGSINCRNRHGMNSTYNIKSFVPV